MNHARRYPRCLALFVLIALCLAAVPEARAGKPAPPGPLGPLGPKDVWQLPRKPWQACLDKAPAQAACLTRLMQQTGATASALAVNRFLEGDGFLSAFRELGRVDLATMTFPLRANTNEAAFLVNGSPPLVSTELDTPVAITADPAYAGLKKAFPDLELWPSSAVFRSMDSLADGGQGFVFAYPLLNGCHACALAGHALVSLDFDRDGVYRGPRLLRLLPAGK